MNSHPTIGAVILDDEKPGIEMLEWNIREYCPSVQVIATFTDPKTALASIKSTVPQLLFLDIEMPGMNGFEFLLQLGEVPMHVIFVTAYDQFAIRAFKVSAFDYLLKPIDKDDLIQSIANLQRNIAEHDRSHQMDLLQKALHQPTKPLGKIALSTFEGLEFVKVDQIVRCEADDNYANVYLEGGRKVLVSKTLKEIEGILKDHGFLRVHYSHLVNLNKITRYVKGDGGYVIMDSGDTVNVSRSKKEQFLNTFSNW